MTNRYNHNSFIIREYRKEDFSGISQLWVITELSNTKRGDDEKSIEASLDLVKKRGHQVKLEVHKTNKKAINLYKKYGFKSLGDYKIYIIRDIAKL